MKPVEVFEKAADMVWEAGGHGWGCYATIDWETCAITFPCEDVYRERLETSDEQRTS